MEDQACGRGGTGRRKGLKIPGDALESLEFSGNSGAVGLVEAPANSPALETARGFGPDARIIDELAHVRRLNRRCPPPRRGLIYFDFKANRVAIAAVLP